MGFSQVEPRALVGRILAQRLFEQSSVAIELVGLAASVGQVVEDDAVERLGGWAGTQRLDVLVRPAYVPPRDGGGDERLDPVGKQVVVEEEIGAATKPLFPAPVLDLDHLVGVQKQQVIETAFETEGAGLDDGLRPGSPEVQKRRAVEAARQGRHMPLDDLGGLVVGARIADEPRVHVWGRGVERSSNHARLVPHHHAEADRLHLRDCRRTRSGPSGWLASGGAGGSGRSGRPARPAGGLRGSGRTGPSGRPRGTGRAGSSFARDLRSESQRPDGAGHPL